MDTLQSFYNTDSKKLAPLATPPRQPGDMAFFNRTDPIGELNTTIIIIIIIISRLTWIVNLKKTKHLKYFIPSNRALMPKY